MSDWKPGWPTPRDIAALDPVNDLVLLSTRAEEGGRASAPIAAWLLQSELAEDVIAMARYEIGKLIEANQLTPTDDQWCTHQRLLPPHEPEDPTQ